MKKIITPELPIEFDEDDLWENNRNLTIRDLDKNVKSEWSVSDKMVSTLRKETEGLKYDPIPFKSDNKKIKQKCPVCGRNFTLKNGKFPQHGERGFYRYLDGTEKKDCKGGGAFFTKFISRDELRFCEINGEIYNVRDKVLILIQPHERLMELYFGEVGFFRLTIDEISCVGDIAKLHFKNIRNGLGISVERLKNNICKDDGL